MTGAVPTPACPGSDRGWGSQVNSAYNSKLFYSASGAAGEEDEDRDEKEEDRD